MSAVSSRQRKGKTNHRPWCGKAMGRKYETGIKKSLQKLDGKGALAYVRDRRDPLGDISRVRRQQKFLQALAAEILNYEHKWKLSPELARLYGNLETDISLEEMCGTYDILREADLEHIRMELVPGSFYNHRGISYWKPDQNKTDLIVSSIFRQAGQGHKTQSSTP